MGKAENEKVKKCLSSGSHVHREWEKKYLGAENDTFFELAFDYIAGVLKAPKDSVILDAGCGKGDQSIRLANRGFFVQGVDFAAGELAIAENNIRHHGLEKKVRLTTGDICALDFADNSFDYVMSWGVLMHVPDIDRAIAQLCRVLKPGGTLVIGENNMFSLDIWAKNIVKKLLRKKEHYERTSAGLVFWHEGVSGTYMVRATNIAWLISKFKEKGLTVRRHTARQFTEIYTNISNIMVRRIIHAFNNMYFKYCKCPTLALGNLLILQKEQS